MRWKVVRWFLLRSSLNTGSKPVGICRAFSEKSNQRKRPAKDVLDIIVCPLSRSQLFYWEKTHELISLTARVAYPVYDNGVVNLCPYDARVLKDDEQFELNKQ